MKINFFFLTPCPLLRRRQQPRCLLSIFHAGVLGLQAQGSLHEKLKYLFAPNLAGAHPLGGGRTGWVQAAAPRQTGRKSGFSRPARLAGGYRLRPIWVGQRGDCLLVDQLFFGCRLIQIVVYASYNRRGICRLRPIEIHPFRGGGRAGRGIGGFVRHCSCLGTPE